jgi:hypothetical protein
MRPKRHGRCIHTVYLVQHYFTLALQNMTASTLTRAASAILLGLSLASIGANAASASSGSFNVSPANLAPLGLPDRDVIRDPYGTFSGGGSLLIPQTLGVVGPNLGLGVGFAPGMIIGGGGGGGGGAGGGVIPSSLGLSSGGSVGGPSSMGGPNGGSNPSNVVGSQQNNGGSNSPSTGNSTSSPGFIIQQQVAPSANVPDGGASVILLGCGLLVTFLLRRRLSGK